MDVLLVSWTLIVQGRFPDKGREGPSGRWKKALRFVIVKKSTP
jgi:hypothetical protein